MENQTTTRGRITELDAVRGLSALAILFCHLPHGFWFGETAVDLFFVLSGYLITSIIIKNCRRDRFLITFYGRRSLRIWPIYYLAIGVVVVVNIMRRSPDRMDALPYYLAYLQNIQLYWGGVRPVMANALAHTWTLAIEEQFYLIWPALLLLAGRKYVTPTAVFFAVLPGVLRAFGLSREVLFAHCDGLALGALLASFKANALRPPSARESRTYLAICLACLGLYAGLWALLSSRAYTGKQMIAYNPSIILISLSYFGLIGYLVSNSGRNCLRWLRSPALAYLGQISYGLYLYHWVLYDFIDTKIKFGLGYKDPWWLDVIKVATSVVVAVLSWHFLEKPILTLKDRFAYDKDRLPARESRTAVPPDGSAGGSDTEAPPDPVYQLDPHPAS